MSTQGRQEKPWFLPGPFFRLALKATVLFGVLSLSSPCVSSALAETDRFDESVLKKVQALEDLKEKQPDIYQKKIQALRERVQKNAEAWRTQKPDIYDKFMQRSLQRDQHHREFVRQKHPDRYLVYQKRQEQRKKNHAAPQRFTETRTKSTPHPADGQRARKNGSDHQPSLNSGQRPRKSQPARQTLRAGASQHTHPAQTHRQFQDSGKQNSPRFNRAQKKSIFQRPNNGAPERPTQSNSISRKKLPQRQSPHNARQRS